MATGARPASRGSGIAGRLGGSLLALGLGATMLAAPAHAADTASLNVLGYSSDGKVFAFEEYGVQDGSGFAYSNIYFLDLEKDAFLQGTPVKVLVEEEESLARIRGMARQKAEPLIGRYGIGDHPGAMVAFNPPSETDSDPHRIRYTAYLQMTSPEMAFTLQLTEKEFPPSSECLNMVGNYTGFLLKLTESNGKVADLLVHDDKQIPKSRNCPNSYRIGGVVTPETLDAPHVAMILVASFGFEGNDQRWIAVPVKPAVP